VTVLRGTKIWKRPKSTKQRATARPSELMPDEQARVLVLALRLRALHRSWKAFAAALGVERVALYLVCKGRRHVTGGLAIKVARLAKMPVEDVLAGR
jgi:plasmid maintenance system antidote protein VapI